jgi:signal transduction histidine kinase
MTAPNVFVHDMKNLLGIILGYSDMLLDEMAASDPRHADVAEIKEAAERALALLDRRAGSSSPEEGA